MFQNIKDLVIISFVETKLKNNLLRNKSQGFYLKFMKRNSVP
jgi:hypothetical protein